MGFYINPKDGTSKEQWLDTHGKRIPRPDKHREGSSIAICLVDNGAFTAAAIAYNQRELEAFQYPGDYRRKQWWHVPEASLAEFLHGQEIEP